MALDRRWRKSSKSYYNGECVEVRWAEPFVEVRDSKDPAGAILRIAPEDWILFLRGLKSGELDLAADPPAGPRVSPCPLRRAPSPGANSSSTSRDGRPSTVEH